MHVVRSPFTKLVYSLFFKVFFFTVFFFQIFSLKSEYNASDPVHAYVYILCLHSVVFHEYTFITIASHKNPYIINNHLLRLKEQTGLFCKAIHNKHRSVHIKSWNNS